MMLHVARRSVATENALGIVLTLGGLFFLAPPSEPGSGELEWSTPEVAASNPESHGAILHRSST